MSEPRRYPDSGAVRRAFAERLAAMAEDKGRPKAEREELRRMAEQWRATLPEGKKVRNSSLDERRG